MFIELTKGIDYSRTYRAHSKRFYTLDIESSSSGYFGINMLTYWKDVFRESISQEDGPDDQAIRGMFRFNRVKKGMGTNWNRFIQLFWILEIKW